MSSYESLAMSYDGLTEDIAYELTLQFIEAIAKDKGKSPSTVLDLACGTGSLSLLLAEGGYKVLGADMSQDMLMVAYDKCLDLDNRPQFICQSMQELELPQPVDMVVCALDSINYLDKPEDCKETFKRVFENLQSGGLFIFDINSQTKLRGLDGQVFLDENDDTYCVWRAEFDEEENICYYGMDIFQREDDIWVRSFEEHREYAYSVQELKEYLTLAGFDNIDVYGERVFSAPSAEEQRIYFVSTKE